MGFIYLRSNNYSGYTPNPDYNIIIKITMESIKSIRVNGFNIPIDRISSLGEAVLVRKNNLMNHEALSYKGTSYAKADVFLYNYDYLFNSVGLALVPRAESDNPIYHGSGIYESRYGLKVVKLVPELKGLDSLCERFEPWIFNLPEVGWGDFWVIPMTVEGFMGTLCYGTYSRDEVRKIYESKGISLI